MSDKGSNMDLVCRIAKKIGKKKVEIDLVTMTRWLENSFVY